jgi:hypothetical protein
MRLPFDSSGYKMEEDARVKFLFNSPELHQNIEISLDGESTSVEALIDAFQRFLGALGIVIPENVVLGFVELESDEDVDDSDDDDDDDDDDEDDEDDDDNIPPPNKNNKKK